MFGSENDFYAAIATIVVVVLIVFGLTILLFRNEADLEDGKAEASYGNMYKDLFQRKNRKGNGWMVSGLWYYPMLMIRRILFLLIPTFVLYLPIFQMQLLLLLNLLFTIFYFTSFPFIDKAKLVLEVFNEIIITIMCMHIIVFMNV